MCTHALSNPSIWRSTSVWSQNSVQRSLHCYSALGPLLITRHLDTCSLPFIAPIPLLKQASRYAARVRFAAHQLSPDSTATTIVALLRPALPLAEERWSWWTSGSSPCSYRSVTKSRFEDSRLLCATLYPKHTSHDHRLAVLASLTLASSRGLQDSGSSFPPATWFFHQLLCQFDAWSDLSQSWFAKSADQGPILHHQSLHPTSLAWHAQLRLPRSAIGARCIVYEFHSFHLSAFDPQPYNPRLLFRFKSNQLALAAARLTSALPIESILKPHCLHLPAIRGQSLSQLQPKRATSDDYLLIKPWVARFPVRPLTSLFHVPTWLAHALTTLEQSASLVLLALAWTEVFLSPLQLFLLSPAQRLLFLSGWKLSHDLFFTPLVLLLNHHQQQWQQQLLQ